MQVFTSCVWAALCVKIAANCLCWLRFCWSTTFWGPRCWRAWSWHMVQSLTYFAPWLCSDYFLVQEALSVDLWVSIRPAHASCGGHMHPDVLVVHDPRWPFIFSGILGHVRHVCHKGPKFVWVTHDQCSCIHGKTLCPGLKVWYEPLSSFQILELDYQYMAFPVRGQWSGSPFGWRQIGEIDVFSCLDFFKHFLWDQWKALAEGYEWGCGEALDRR